MGYDVTPMELYGWAMFFFNTPTQRINIAFMHLEDNKYMVIVFSEDGKPLQNPHEEDFMKTVNTVIDEFDNNRELIYEMFAE